MSSLSFIGWLKTARELSSAAGRKRRAGRTRLPAFRHRLPLHLEALEARWLPSNTYTVTLGGDAGTGV